MAGSRPGTGKDGAGAFNTPRGRTKTGEYAVEEGLVVLRTTILSQLGNKQKALEFFDVDGDGTITFKELNLSLKDAKINVKELTGVDLKSIFSLLDIDGSGDLSIEELMDTSPWRAEEEGVLNLRASLLKHFGSKQSVIKGLDTDTNGDVSLDELEKWMKKTGISIEDCTGGIDLQRVFDLLDTDMSGELSIEELLTGDPREYGKDRDDTIAKMRNTLVTRYGSTPAVMKAFDTNGNGTLSLFELDAGLKRAQIGLGELLGNKDIKWLFKVLDVSNRGELNTKELCEQDPHQAAMKMRFVQKEKIRKQKEKRAKSKLIIINRMAAKQQEAERLKEEVKQLEAEVSGEPPKDEKLKRAPDTADPEATPTVSPRTPSKLSGVERKMDVFSKTPDADELSLRQACIGEKGAKRLAVAIAAHARSLNSLDLCGNYMMSAGTRFVLGALERHCSVKKLNLSWNGLDDFGARRVAQFVRRMKQLQELDVAYNRIGDDGAQDLASVLPGSSVRLLDLRGNQLQNASARAIQLAKKQVAKMGGKRKVNVLIDEHLMDAGSPSYSAAAAFLESPDAYIWTSDVGHPPKKGLAAFYPADVSVESLGQKWGFAPSLPPVDETSRGASKGALNTQPSKQKENRRPGSRSRPGSRVNVVIGLDRAPVTLPQTFTAWPAGTQLAKSVSDAIIIGGSRVATSPKKAPGSRGGQRSASQLGSRSGSRAGTRQQTRQQPETRLLCLMAFKTTPVVTSI